jgi:phosphoribosylglycinamide formyltransferase-1
VLVSGSGTILETMIEANLPVAFVLADRPCRALEIAARHGVDAELIERTEFGASFDRVEYTDRVVKALQERSIELVAMAGFGTVLAPAMFDQLPGRVINTHPALLPSFIGWHAVRDALAYGVKVTGCTVHVATPEVDHGPILAQEAVPVLDDDTESTLHERIKAVERRLYVQTIRDILEKGSVT